VDVRSVRGRVARERNGMEPSEDRGRGYYCADDLNSTEMSDDDKLEETTASRPQAAVESHSTVRAVLTISIDRREVEANWSQVDEIESEVSLYHTPPLRG
jgi:hypothetical protein